MTNPHIDIRKHMDRRYECPACGKAMMIVHKSSLRFPVQYTCPNCKHVLETQPEQPEAA